LRARPFVLPLGLVLAACQPPAASGTDAAAAADAPTTPAPAAYAGWYAGGRFQPCGKAALPVPDPTTLERALRDAGLAAGEPVYVRVRGFEDAGRFQLRGILQVGSPSPVRDCPMTGTTTN
jgi:hypothetical protein